MAKKREPSAAKISTRLAKYGSEEVISKKRRGLFPLLVQSHKKNSNNRLQTFTFFYLINRAYFKAHEQGYYRNKANYIALMFMCYMGRKTWLKESELRALYNIRYGSYGMILSEWGKLHGLIETKKQPIQYFTTGYMILYRPTDKAMRLYKEFCKELNLKD